jgi:DNA-binding LacI/PurR family transcriptional regulator
MLRTLRSSVQRGDERSQHLKAKSKATLYDIAAAAGVSIATASKALNDVPVSAANKGKVLKAAARLGYVVNEAARALRRNRSHTIGLIFSELSTTRRLGLLDAMSGALEAAGYSLICATARADAGVYDVLMRRFLERRVDGLFCVTPPERLPSVRHYRSAGIPIVAVTERSPALTRQPLVRPSIGEAVRALLADIVRLGHRRMLFLDDGSGGPSMAAMDARWPRNVDIEFLPLADVGALDQFVRNVLEQKKRCTLIGAIMAQAEGVLAVCRAAGIKVSDDMSIIALTNTTNEKRAEQLNLSSVLIRPQLLGADAVVQMLRLLDGKKAPKDISVEVGRWTLRDSVGRAYGDT